MILAKRPRSDAEHGRAGSHKESKITSDFATSYCYHCPGHLDVVLPTRRLGFVPTSFMLNFQGSIHSQPCYHNLPSCVGFQSWWFGGGESSTTRPPVSITQFYWRATTEGVDQQHCRWWFFDKKPYSTAHIDNFLIQYPFCAKNTICLVETMITNVFWVQDSTPYYPLRCVGILKLSTHTA